MANWASTSYRIEGNQKDLQELNDLCKELGVKDLTGCTLDKQPSHGTWISKEDIGHL